MKTVEKYPVNLSEAERQQLNELIRAGKAPATRIRRAYILLKTDQSEGGPSWTYSQIAEAFGVSKETISRVRQSYSEGGLERALSRKLPERMYPRRLDGVQEAQLTVLACSEPPEGYGRWSLRLLADRFVALGYIPAISHETVRQVMKKMNSSRG